MEKKDLEQVTDNICKKEENKKQEVDTTGNNVEPSSPEQKGTDEVKDEMCICKTEETKNKNS